MIIRLILIVLTAFSLTSCIGLKDLNLLQNNENTVINENGLIAHTYEPYRLQVDDYVKVVIETQDPDAKEFFSDKNLIDKGGSNNVERTGLRIESDGYIHLLGLGSVKLAGLTIEQATVKVQEMVNDTYIENMAIVRLYNENLNFTIMGEVGNPGVKKSEDTTINLVEALALSGDFTKLANRREVHIFRQYPEGIKKIDVDFTREDIINSPYFYIHPNDFIIVDARIEKVTGLGGKTTVQDITQLFTLTVTGIAMYTYFKNL